MVVEVSGVFSDKNLTPLSHKGALMSEGEIQSLPDFPAELPLDSVRELLDLIRSGRVREEWQQSLKLACWIAGSATELLSPTDVVVQSEQTFDEVCEDLQNQLEHTDSDVMTTQAIDPALLYELIKLVYLIIKSRG